MDSYKTLVAIKEVIDAALPAQQVKTVGKQDFTGYSLESLQESVDLLRELSLKSQLPGPLAQCRKAIVRAYDEVLNKSPAPNQTLSEISADLKKKADARQASSKLRALIRKDTAE